VTNGLKAQSYYVDSLHGRSTQIHRKGRENRLIPNETPPFSLSLSLSFLGGKGIMLKWMLQKGRGECRLDSFGLGQGPVAGLYEHHCEPAGFLESGECLNCLSCH
jgi:hypothetical protein